MTINISMTSFNDKFCVKALNRMFTLNNTFDDIHLDKGNRGVTQLLYARPKILVTDYSQR